MAGVIHCCDCKRCKKARRKGLILGSRWEFSWKHGLCRVSDYVPYHRWQKGRRRKDKSLKTHSTKAV